MIEFLLASANFPFTISLAIMLIIAIIEGITTMLGSGIFSFLDAMLPEIDLDVDTPDLGHHGSFAKFLAWIRIGEVPGIILLVLLLTSYGLFGLAIQLFGQALTGKLFPALLVSIPALFLSFFMVRALGSILAKIIPQDETDAVSEETFVGRVAVITLGQARRGKPAQAKLRDAHGQTHYVMVEPDSPDIIFEQGQTILLTEQSGAVFHATDQIPDCLISD
jgi:hypothetical protein